MNIIIILYEFYINYIVYVIIPLLSYVMIENWDATS